MSQLVVVLGWPSPLTPYQIIDPPVDPVASRAEFAAWHMETLRRRIRDARRSLASVADHLASGPSPEDRVLYEVSSAVKRQSTPEQPTPVTRREKWNRACREFEEGLERERYQGRSRGDEGVVADLRRHLSAAEAELRMAEATPPDSWPLTITDRIDAELL